VRIATDAVFGISLMKKCTALGDCQLSGLLPKTASVAILTARVDALETFDAIGQKCKRLRSTAL